jgi:hypothetical protein
MYWIFHSIVLKPLNLHVSPWKGLRYQRVVLIVQEKTDCPISETGLSDFHGFNPLGRTYPFAFFPHFSLSFSQEQSWGWPQDPHWQFLDSSMKSWSSWVNSTPQEPVSLIPPPVFYLLKVIWPNPWSLCPMVRFKIPLVHCLLSSPSLSLCNISWNRWINWSDW